MTMNEFVVILICLSFVAVFAYVVIMDFSTHHPDIVELQDYCITHPNTTLYPEYAEWWHLFGYSRHLSINCTMEDVN